jgi:hypothetical protein
MASCFPIRCPELPLLEVKDPYEPICGFKRHPNSSSKPVVDFSSLGPRTLEQLFMFDKAILDEFFDKPSELKQFVAHAFQRYKAFLKLKLLHPDLLLIPTVDIEMCWRSHLLRPEKYKTDTEALFGKILPHPPNGVPAWNLLKKQARQTTSSIWQEQFGVVYLKGGAISHGEKVMEDCWFVPLDVHTLQADVDEKEIADVKISLNEEDILRDRNWIKDVVDAVDHNPLAPGEFLWEAVIKSYERYLFMILITPSEKLCNPTLLIDVAWHAHMLDPILYREDMLRILEFVPDHDGSSQREETDQAQTTSNLWEQQFGIALEDEHLFVRLKESGVRPLRFRSDLIGIYDQPHFSIFKQFKDSEFPRDSLPNGAQLDLFED